LLKGFWIDCDVFHQKRWRAIAGLSLLASNQEL
jgi:hypothetical protein